MYYIGIDGGGSTSRLVATDMDFNVIGRSRGLATNPESLPKETVADNIKNLIESFNKETGTRLEECKAICIGTAGVDGDRNVALMDTIFRDIGFKGIAKIVADAAIALMAKTKGEAGIVIISGTGSIGYAIDEQGKTSRCGGWGALIDDAGSGYRIGVDALRSAFMDFDGRGPKTVLTALISKHYEITRIDEVIKLVYALPFDKSKIAQLSSLVRQAAELHDHTALAIEAQAAEDLALLAKTLIRLNKLENHTIVMSGGILLNNENIQSQFKKKVKTVYADTKITPLDVEAEMGAIYLAALESGSRISAP